MYCKNCGKLIDEKSDICFHCHTPVKEKKQKTENKFIERIKENMNNKSDDELIKIWKDNNREEWRDEVFEIIEQILSGRGRKLPVQVEAKVNTTETTKKSTLKKPKYYGVKGWLLFFCLILLVFRPIVSSFLLVIGFGELDRVFRYYPGLKIVTIIDIMLTIGILIFGICAGIFLLIKKSNAVRTAKSFLIIDLLYSIFGGLLPFFAGLPSSANEYFGVQYLKSLVGAIIFFAIWNSFLNKSKRVRVTYGIIETTGSPEQETPVKQQERESELSFMNLKGQE